MRIEEEGLDDLMAAIEDTIGGFDEDLETDLASYVADLKNHMVRGLFKSRTGNLRSSMRASLVDDYSIQLSMAYYGYFLAFGVDIRKQTHKRTFGVLPDAANSLNTARRGRIIPTNGTYIFGSKSRAKRVFGIAARGTTNPAEGSSARSFYPDNIIEYLEELLLKYNKL